jgi:uncharacterized membrane protein
VKLRVPPIALWFAPGACVASGLTAVTAAPAAAVTSVHTMTGLGSLGYGVGRGFGISAAGEVAGQWYTDKTVRFPCGRHSCTAHICGPVSWIGGTMTGLGTLGGILGEARAVTGNGDIAGGFNGDVFLGRNGMMTDPGPGEASGITGFGEIAGGISGAAGINDRHQIVGGSCNAPGCGHAVMGSNATVTGPGTLGGTPGAASAVNDLGQVVGWAPTASQAPACSCGAAAR